MALPSTANVSRPLSRGYGLRINDLYLRLAVTPDTPIERATAPRQPQRIDTRQNPEDFIADDFAVIFSRSDVTGGEGLDFAHSRNSTPLDITRFWDSHGIDVSPGLSGQVSTFHLLKEIVNLNADGEYLAALGDKVFISSGEDLYVTSNPFSATPTVSTESPHLAEGATDITDLLSFNGHVYAGVADGVHRTDGGGTWTHWSDQTVTKMWAVKGRILAADGNELFEVKEDATSNSIYVLSAGYTFTSVIEAGQFILAASDDGTIYAFTFNEETLATTLTSRTELINEYPTALGFRAGVLLVGTAHVTQNGIIGRLYTGRVADDGTVQLALKRQWGDSDTDLFQYPANITVSRDYAFFSLHEGTHSHIWKYDFATTGLFRNIGDEGLDAITDIIIHQGRLFFAATGAYLEGSSYVSTGYLISPLIDFLTPEPKAWTALATDTEEMQANTSVESFYSTNPASILDSSSPSWIKGQQITSGRDTRYSRVIRTEPSRYAALKIVLNSTNGTNTPRVKSFAIKAYPGASDIIIRIPVNISDNVELPHKRKIRIKGYGSKIYSYLKDIQDSSVEVELLRPKELIRGIIEEVSDRIPSVTHRGSPTFIAFITIRGRRVSETGTSESSAAIGIGNLGLIAVGGHNANQ